MRSIVFALLLSACMPVLSFRSANVPNDAVARSRMPHPHASMAREVQSAACDACHAMQPTSGHPVNFTPRRPLPAAFQLSAQGRFVCQTCHEFTSSAAGRSSRVAHCEECHQPSFFSAMADGGYSLFGSTHSFIENARDFDAPGLDLASARCLECHSGHAQARMQRVAMGGARQPSLRDRNHPVGSVYQTHVGFGGYVPLARVPAQVALPDGRLSCVSCHDSYSARHGAVVTLAAGGSLCMACHDL